MLPGPDGPGVIDRAHEDAPVAHLARTGGGHDGLDGRFDELFPADDGDLDPGNNVGGIHHTAIDAVLPVLADGLDFRIGEPVDVGVEERLLDILEVRLAHDGFDFFHLDTTNYKVKHLVLLPDRQ